MPGSRRVWCSCVILDYLKGAPNAEEQCGLIIEAAEKGQTEIIVSALAEAEVGNIEGELPEYAEDMIREFFSRPYVLKANLDPPVAEIARDLIRKYRIKGADAAHVATALHWNIPVFETYDGPLSRKINANLTLLPSPLIVREPFWEGQAKMGDLFSSGP